MDVSDQAGRAGLQGRAPPSWGWVPFDLPCGDTQLWARGESDRYQTRYYNEDYLDSYREFRTHDIDYLSTSPTGPATATITTNVRFDEPFAVPGDDQTRTIITHGVLWDIRSPRVPRCGVRSAPWSSPRMPSGPSAAT